MKFNKLSIQNFLSIQKIELDLENLGLVLLKGRNLDNPECDSNGAGKSSILEAFTYSLYGRTTRGLRGDDIIHNIPKKNMKIFLDIEDDDGTKYRIARYRKHSTNKNKSLIFRNGKDITPKSEADVNSYIANLLQADYLTFTSSLLYSQESFKFTSATDAEMKSTFDLMLGLDVFSKCLDITKTLLKDVENGLSTSVWKIQDYEEKIQDYEHQIEDAGEKHEIYEERKKSKIEQYNNAKRELVETLKDLNLSLNIIEKSLDKKEIEKTKAQQLLESLRKKLSKVDELKSELKELQSEILQNDRTIKSCNSDIDVKTSRIKSINSKIDTRKSKIEDLAQSKQDLDKGIGQKCPTCGQPMTYESLEPARLEYDEKIEELQKEIIELTSQCSSYDEEKSSLLEKIEELQEDNKDINETIVEFETLLKKYKGLVDDKDAAESQLDTIKEEYFSISSKAKFKKSEISLTTEQLEQIEIDLLELTEEENPYSDIINKFTSQIVETQKKIKELKENSKDLVDEKERLIFWQQAYSNQGIKSLILDDITPFLNRRVNKYLTKLTSGHIEVKFSTQTTLKSGEKREKFSIDISNQDGGNEYISNSGGEKKRIDLAINLALQDLVASRSTKRINIAIFDEIFDALDSTGIENVVDLLKDLSQEKSTIIVISHNEHLKSYFDNIITVVKKNGFSTLLNSDVNDTEEE